MEMDLFLTTAEKKHCDANFPSFSKLLQIFGIADLRNFTYFVALHNDDVQNHLYQQPIRLHKKSWNSEGEGS